MLHMVVITHGPDTCPASHPENREPSRYAHENIDQVAKKLSITVHGWWVDPPAHVFYILADAPNAHAVNTLVSDLRLFLWNTIDIHPVMTMAEAMQVAARAREARAAENAAGAG